MKVSVIIPVFNAEKYLNECIASVVCQTEVGQIILIDDGSTDSSAKILNKWEKDDNRVKVIYNPKHINRGSGYSRNLGIDLVTCTFVNFLDADDYMLQDRFVETIELFRVNDNIDGVYESIRVEKSKEHKVASSMDFRLSQEVNSDQSLEAILCNTYGGTQLGGFTYRNTIFKNTTIRCTQHKRGQELNLIWEAAINTNIVLLSSDHKMVRRLHDRNAVLSEQQGNIDRTSRSIEWFNKMKEYDLPTAANRFFFKYYVQNRDGLNMIKSRPIRVLSKIFFGVKSIVLNPRLIKKLM